LYLKYLKGYEKYIRNPIGKYAEAWKYSHTSLEYFWDELGYNIKNKDEKKEEIKLSYNLYLIINNLCRDSGVKISDFYVRKRDLKTVSISIFGRYLIKEYALQNAENYIKIVSNINSSGEICHIFNMEQDYYEVLNLLKEIIKNNR